MGNSKSNMGKRTHHEPPLARLPGDGATDGPKFDLSMPGDNPFPSTKKPPALLPNIPHEAVDATTGSIGAGAMLAVKRATQHHAEELEKLERLQNPNIAKVLGFHASAGSSTLRVIEFMNLGSLFDYLDRVRHGLALPLTWDERITVVVHVVRGLVCMHDTGKVHCDVKSGSILLHRDAAGRLVAKLVDLGLACSPGLRFHPPAPVPGTVAYMSPEALVGLTSEKRDAFSLGVVVCELLTGKPPTGVSTGCGEMLLHEIVTDCLKQPDWKQCLAQVLLDKKVPWAWTWVEQHRIERLCSVVGCFIEPRHRQRKALRGLQPVLEELRAAKPRRHFRRCHTDRWPAARRGAAHDPTGGLQPVWMTGIVDFSFARDDGDDGAAEAVREAPLAASEDAAGGRMPPAPIEISRVDAHSPSMERALLTAAVYCEVQDTCAGHPEVAQGGNCFLRAAHDPAFARLRSELAATVIATNWRRVRSNRVAVRRPRAGVAATAAMASAVAGADGTDGTDEEDESKEGSGFSDLRTRRKSRAARLRAKGRVMTRDAYEKTLRAGNRQPTAGMLPPT
jgi:hypothetical protein